MDDFIKDYLMDSKERFDNKRGVSSYTAYKHYKKTFDADLAPVGIVVLLFFVFCLVLL